MVHIPAQMLAGDFGPQIDPVKTQHLVVMFGHHLGHCGPFGDHRFGAPVQVMRDLRQQPRPPLRPTPNHHAVCARQAQRCPGLFATDDVAIGDDGDIHCLFHRADRSPIGAALVELTAGAPVDGDHLHARVLGPFRDWRGVEHIVVPAEPGFECNRHVDRADHRFDQPQRVIGRFHQCRAGGALRHLFGRAAHVNVDDPRAHRLDHPRGFGHRFGLAPCKLDGGADDIQPQLRFLPRAGAAAEQFLAGDHLGHDQSGPESRHEAAIGQIGDPRHRGEEYRRVECQGVGGHVLNPCAVPCCVALPRSDLNETSLKSSYAPSKCLFFRQPPQIAPRRRIA